MMIFRLEVHANRRMTEVIGKSKRNIERQKIPMLFMRLDGGLQIIFATATIEPFL
ncbi:hypothetical protein BJV82DRAFT_594310 [Fennellomyces sp. T-0311]|nr:hypothetical protein BJV82DRAFT_594310 [Fennellomyces sp. T-0311]